MADITNTDQTSLLMSQISSLQATVASLQSQIEELQSSIGENQQTLRRTQNSSGKSSGTGSPLGGTTNLSTSSQTTLTAGGQAIPFVSGVTAQVVSTTSGRTNVRISWVDLADPQGLVDCYNVWLVGSITGQTQETQVAASHVSPAVFAVPQGIQGTVQIGVQTQYKNGRTNNIMDCPFVSIVVGPPTINPSDLNFGSIILTNTSSDILLSGFTFSITGSGPYTINWTSGTISYQGVSYAISSGSSNPGDLWVLWNGSASVFTSANSLTPPLGLEFTVASIDTRHLYSPVVQLTDGAFQQSLMQAGHVFASESGTGSFASIQADVGSASVGSNLGAVQATAQVTSTTATLTTSAAGGGFSFSTNGVTSSSVIDGSAGFTGTLAAAISAGKSVKAGLILN